jgi:small subunit ribosomal protein S11
MAKKTTTVKKKVVKVGAQGAVHVHSTFNNVIVTITNENGDVISWSSAGKMGFRGSKKNTPYAAQTAAQDCAKVAFDMGLRKVRVYVKGPGQGRESAIRTINGAGIEVIEIIDVTPLPHNGCRPPNRRRV